MKNSSFNFFFILLIQDSSAAAGFECFIPLQESSRSTVRYLAVFGDFFLEGWVEERIGLFPISTQNLFKTIDLPEQIPGG